ncbi:MAG: hypothetical protein R2706_08675 [Acidimicrobiales bacterium]
MVDVSATPIERIDASGIQTTEAHVDLDVIIFATGFDAITGGYDRIDIRGVDGQPLSAKWQDSPSTYLGMFIAGFPNMLMVAGPQSVSGSTNFPRAIEKGVDWLTELLVHVNEHGFTRVEATAAAEEVGGRGRPIVRPAAPSIEQGLVYWVQLERCWSPRGPRSVPGVLRRRAPVRDEGRTGCCRRLRRT